MRCKAGSSNKQLPANSKGQDMKPYLIGAPLLNNASLYYTVNGKRNPIKYVNAPVALGAWHTLRVDFHGETIRVSLNGKTYIDLKNDKITGTGDTGVWTKADSVTLFDDFVAEGKADR